MLYRLVGATVDQARVLVNLAVAFHLQDRTETAIETTLAALHSLTPEENLRLYVCARYNLASYLTDLGEYQDAERLIAADREGRTEEVKRLAEEMLPIFTAADVHREALAALIVFVEAAKQEQLTVALTQEIGKYLRDARADPSLRFAKEEPS